MNFGGEFIYSIKLNKQNIDSIIVYRNLMRKYNVII